MYLDKATNNVSQLPNTISNACLCPKNVFLLVWYCHKSALLMFYTVANHAHIAFILPCTKLLLTTLVPSIINYLPNYFCWLSNLKLLITFDAKDFDCPLEDILAIEKHTFLKINWPLFKLYWCINFIHVQL